MWRCQPCASHIIDFFFFAVCCFADAMALHAAQGSCVNHLQSYTRGNEGVVQQGRVPKEVRHASRVRSLCQSININTLIIGNNEFLDVFMVETF